MLKYDVMVRTKLVARASNSNFLSVDLEMFIVLLYEAIYPIGF